MFCFFVVEERGTGSICEELPVPPGFGNIDDERVHAMQGCFTK